jgi:putative ABC transport system permease protein
MSTFNLFVNDVRYAVRSIRLNLTTFVLAIGLLAVGIGSTSAVFAVVNAVLIKPLPFPNAERVAMIWATQPQLKFLSRVPVSAADFADFQRRATVFEKLAALDSDSYALTGIGEPRQITAARVTSDFFSILGVSAAIGRTFVPEEDQPQRNRVVVIGYGFWKRYFGGDQNAIGKSLILNDVGYRIVGVASPGFRFPEARSLPAYFEFPLETEIWMPLGMSAKRLADRRSHDLAVFGLLNRGRTLDQARAEMTSIARQLERENPEQAQWLTEVVSLKEQSTSDVRTPLLVLQIAVLSVLLIACTNVAGLLLARGAARRREIAIRSAIGASPGRIIVQLLTESVVLSGTGGLLGIGLAYAIIAVFSRTAAPLLQGGGIGMDRGALAFAVVVSLATGLLAGVIPSITSAKPDLVETLKEGGKGSSGGLRSQRIRSALVISQLAVAFLLCMSAGILVRSYETLLDVSPGFRVANVFTFELSLAEHRYPHGESRTRFYRELMRRVSGITGAEAAGVVSYLPLKGEAGLDIYRVEGRPADKPGSEPIVAIRMASPSYFRAMGIPLLEGRLFDESDTASRPLVAVVSQALAKSAWPNSSAVGKRLMVGAAELHHGWEGKLIQVIGVAGDVKPALDSGNRPQIYFSQEQIPWTEMALVVRTSLKPEQLIGPVKNEIYSLDSSQPLLDAKSMQQYLDESVANRRYSTVVLGGFAGIAVLLAAIGLYGLLSYSVLQQRKHVAIRMSLGAQPSDIILWVVRRGMLLAAAGLAAGSILYWFGARLLQTFLFGVQPADAIAVVSALVLFLAITFVACYFPARKSAALDPLLMLREE